MQADDRHNLRDLKCMAGAGHVDVPAVRGWLKVKSREASFGVVGAAGERHGVGYLLKSLAN